MNNSMKTLGFNLLFFITTSFTIKQALTYNKRLMMSLTSKSLEYITFDNRNLRSLPVDPETRIFPRQVINSIFSLVEPSPVLNPTVVAISDDAFELLGINNVNDDEVSKYLSGNFKLKGSTPAAHCYCGHQFGSFVGQLGDGAAMYLGEVINKETGMRWELQLKGAGQTPFSRTADGRKVLRSSVREFLCSEGMHYLNIPTTRSASCVTSDTTVERDPLYDGNAIDEKCTVISRIAPNFFRFGSFEIFKSKSTSDRVGPSAGNLTLKKQFLDYVLLYYPEILGKYKSGEVTNDIVYKEFFTEIMNRTAQLVAKWQSNGFVHGVLNTDNMSIMGITIDYGPYGFMENFDKDFVPNGSDSGGRYSYQKQPEICKWNLLKLGEILDPLIPLDESISILGQYDKLYESFYMKEMRCKLGLLNELSSDKELVDDLFKTLDSTSTDFTDTFQALTDYISSSKSTQDLSILVDKLIQRSSNPTEKIAALRRKMKIHRLQMHPEQIQQLWMLLQSNATEVSDMFSGASVEDIRQEISVEKNKLDKLIDASMEIKRLETVTAESKESSDRNLLGPWIKKYVERIAQEDVISGDRTNIRLNIMRNHNPTFILRNWIAQDAIKFAESGDYSKIKLVLSLLKTPFEQKYSTFLSSYECDDRYFNKAPSTASSLICTCSS